MERIHPETGIYTALYNKNTYYIVKFENGEGRQYIMIDKNNKTSLYSRGAYIATGAWSSYNLFYHKANQEERAWLEACLMAAKFVPLADVQPTLTYDAKVRESVPQYTISAGYPPKKDSYPIF